MGKQYEKKITWAIKNFSTLQCESIRSDPFVVGGCKWLLNLYPKGNMVDNFLSLFLEVDNYGALPSGWRRHARYLLTIENQNSEKTFKPSIESQIWFEEKAYSWGRKSLFPLNELHAKDSGFLVNGELKIVAHVEVLEVVGKLDVSEETSISEIMYVHDFQLLPSQVKFVSRMFEKHSELASEFRPKNPNLRTAYMSFLLSMIQTMCQSPHELSKDDLSDAYTGLGFMTEAGFKLDWLEKKLNEISEKKEKEQASETRLQEMEKELKDLKEKCSNMEAMVEKEKGEVSAAKASRSFDDVV